SCVPLVLESAVMCCPQTGHANLNSLMIARRTIPYLPGADNDIFWQQGGPGSVQELEEKAVAANVRRRNSIAKRNPPPHVGGDASQNWCAERGRVAGHQPRVGCDRTRNRRREVSVATRARGCAHEPRSRADPARAGGCEAPHRPFAERPGGVGSEALAAG